METSFGATFPAVPQVAKGQYLLFTIRTCMQSVNYAIGKHHYSVMKNKNIWAETINKKE